MLLPVSDASGVALALDELDPLNPDPDDPEPEPEEPDPPEPEPDEFEAVEPVAELLTRPAQAARLNSVRLKSAKRNCER